MVAMVLVLALESEQDDWMIWRNSKEESQDELLFCCGRVALLVQILNKRKYINRSPKVVLETSDNRILLLF